MFLTGQLQKQLKRKNHFEEQKCKTVLIALGKIKIDKYCMKFKGQNITDKNLEFNEFFERYFPSLCIFAGNLIKDDIQAKDFVQEVFIKAWRSDNNFENENAFKAFLYLTTKNLCIDYLRQKKNIKLNEYFKEIDNNYLNEIVREEVFRMLDIAIEQLPPARKRIIELSLKGLGNNEISEELKISINTVKTHKLKAYNTIRELMGNQFAAIVLIELINFF